jgi:hypothetical protein
MDLLFLRNGSTASQGFTVTPNVPLVLVTGKDFRMVSNPKS